MAGIPSDPLITARVIGDVLDPFTPTMNLTLSYGYENKQVYNGCEFLPSTVTEVPLIGIYGDANDLDSFFTLVMTDSDVPSPDDPNKREHLHWIFTNIRGTAGPYTNLLLGTDLVMYESPNPNIGMHRFVFALFKQKRMNCVTPPSSRDNFNTRNFAAENDLGTPVAAVYFYAQRET